MKYWCSLLAIVILLNCARKYAPKVDKIEVLYLSSLYEDVYREKPFLAGMKTIPSIKIGHLITDPPCMATFLSRMGFCELLNEFPIDFVISDTLIYNAQYMSIPKSMGYGIKNYEGIRFAILYKDKDSLTIDDNIHISLVEQRSDVLWIIDNDCLDLAPMKINFFIKDRGLVDTAITVLEVDPDTVLLKKLQNFRNRLDKALSKTINLENQRLDEYILSKIALSQGVNVILYPANLFHSVVEKDSVSIKEIIKNVACELKFEKFSNMTKNEIDRLKKEKEYIVWGIPAQTNQVFLPSDSGAFLFDLLFPAASQEIY